MTGCVDLSDPPNGEVTITGITIGSEAFYTCDSGYDLVGSDTRDCVQSDAGTGMWTDMEPQCIGTGMRPWACNVHVNTHKHVFG